MRRQIFEFIITCQRERNFPPTIREIGDHVGLKSPATVANHIEVLKRPGTSKRILSSRAPSPCDLTLKIPLPISTSATSPSSATSPPARACWPWRRARTHVDPRAVRRTRRQLRPGGPWRLNDRSGHSAGRLRRRTATTTANKGEIVVAGIPDGEATVKRYFPQGTRCRSEARKFTSGTIGVHARDVFLFGRVISS
jgi:repressor LexA